MHFCTPTHKLSLYGLETGVVCLLTDYFWKSYFAVFCTFHYIFKLCVNFRKCPGKPCKIGQSKAIQGGKNKWLKYYSCATAVFKGRGKSLDFIGIDYEKLIPKIQEIQKILFEDREYIPVEVCLLPYKKAIGQKRYIEYRRSWWKSWIFLISMTEF